MPAILTATYAAAGLVLGAAACPAAAGALLERRARGIVSYWDRRCDEYAEWRRERKAEPDPKAKGDEGALGIWYEDAKRRLEAGTLPRERAELLSELDPAFAVGEERIAGLPAEEETLAKYGGGIRRLDSAVCAAFMAACCGAIGYLHAPLTSATDALSAFLAMAALAVASIMALTDSKCHILPFELSYALVPLGIICQMAYVLEGHSTPVSSIAGAITYMLIMFGSGAIVSKFAKRKALGAGDLRSTPGLALVCAAAPFPALVGAAATTLLIPIARTLLRSKGVLTMSTPFGPHLAVGCALGLIWPLAYGAWLPF